MYCYVNQEIQNLPQCIGYTVLDENIEDYIEVAFVFEPIKSSLLDNIKERYSK